MKHRPSLYLLTLCTAAFGLLPPAAPADTLPDPATKNNVPPVAMVQAMIWKRLDLADFTLTGLVKSDKNKNQYGIKLLTKGHELIYEFQNQPLQIRVQIDPGSSVVQKRASSSAAWANVSPAEMTQSILDTDITYEDLGIDFVNWDDVEPLGTDSIKTLDCYVFEAKPGPNDHSRFASVRFWVSKQYWTFLRIDGLNAKGQTIKRVEVQNVMQIGKYYVFKEMKVANMEPDKDDIAKSTTYIDIQDGKEGSGLTQ
ncbi:MAG: outer membrane lipoprotein-sorting protein [Methylacidiphilales bacterium]|nr:outer membrane lipoprotein-sorting protein [Candidatus Methylacidiphilales bacterium]